MTRAAAIYLRISLDRNLDGLAIERQREDCLRIARDRGWEVVEQYVDQSRSAFDKRVKRPGYDRLVADYAAGRFEALICYDLDRLTRQPRQLEDWIDAAEDRGLRLVTANGEADLSTDAGRLFARLKAAVARSEGERKGARQSRANQQRAERGAVPKGVRLTGYRTDGSVDEREADAVRRIFADFAEGESLRGLARQLDDTGIRPRRAAAWSPSSVQGLLRNPRYVGDRVYLGETTAGSWVPLVDRDLWTVVQGILDDPRRKTAHGTERKHLGSSLYLCGVCEQPVSAWGGSPRRYRCKDAHVNRSMGPVDAYVVAVVEEVLAGFDPAEFRGDASAEEVRTLSGDARRLRARLRTIDADYDAGEIPAQRWRTATAKATAELQEVENRLARLSASSGPTSVLAAEDRVAQFRSVSLMLRRAVVAALVEVRLYPGTRGRRTFDPATVAIRPTWSSSVTLE